MIALTEAEHEYDSMLHWNELKKHFPSAAKGIISEYIRVKGQIPYELGHVYLLHAKGSPYYKIGKSVAPDKRLLQISPKMPFDTELVKSWTTNFMSIAESWLHGQFSQFRVNGEWFQLPDEYLFHLLIGCELEYTSTIRNAYLATVNIGLSSDNLNNLNEALMLEMDFTCIGFYSIGNSGYTIALVEEWFYQIKECGDAPSFDHSPSSEFLDRLKEGWKRSDWL